MEISLVWGRAEVVDHRLVPDSVNQTAFRKYRSARSWQLHAPETKNVMAPPTGGAFAFSVAGGLELTLATQAKACVAEVLREADEERSDEANPPPATKISPLVQ